MYLKLKWTNRNPNLDHISIYRDTVELDTTNLPSPLVQIPGNSTEYVDEDVVRDTQYHYLIEFVRGSDRILSRPIALKATISTGPGPQDLLSGDYNAGYFGLFPADQFLSSQEVDEHLDGYFSIKPTQWVKYVYKGKICFIPYNCRLSARSWKFVYDQGKVFGVDGPGPLDEIGNPSVTPTNQLYTFNHAGYTFKIRLIGGGEYSEPDSVSVAATTIFTTFPPLHLVERPENEFDSCVRRLFTFNSFSYFGAQLANLDPLNTFRVSATSTVPYLSTLLTQNLRVRGAGLSTASRITFLPSFIISAIVTASTIENMPNYHMPFPVLELIQ